VWGGLKAKNRDVYIASNIMRKYRKATCVNTGGNAEEERE